jgi:hypothetical protein
MNRILLTGTGSLDQTTGQDVLNNVLTCISVQLSTSPLCTVQGSASQGKQLCFVSTSNSTEHNSNCIYSRTWL